MPTALPILSINHVARNTRHLEETRAFYRDLLGFREIPRPNFNFAGAWLYNYGVQIHLIVDESAPQAEGPISTRAEHLALQVNDLDAAEKILNERGIPFRKNHVPERNVTQLFFRDPDGHHIEIGNYPPTKES